jgi:diaminohydroxyphosphoribosylaminopyrimidine deaminase/5-amino-6-(5-phosphoribosylamino)uracil reductase
LFRDRFAERTLVYRRKRLGLVLDNLGRKNITSVLIEGGGEILGQALDGALIDKVQVYLGPIMTGGPVLAFAGRGAADTQHAAHLERVSYTRVADNVCVIGYPKFSPKGGE